MSTRAATSANVAELLRRRAARAAEPPTLGPCAGCGGRLNPSNGRCPRCDAQPLVVSAPPPPPVPSEPDLCGCGKAFGHVGRCRGSHNATADRPAIEPGSATFDCKCGKPLGHRGACRGTRPHNAGRLAPTYTPPPDPEQVAEETRKAAELMGHKGTATTTTEPDPPAYAADPELAAATLAWRAIEGLRPAARRRVLAYLEARSQEYPETRS